MRIPSAATRLIALLGDPVGHSLSPTIQNAGFQAAGVDGVYLALRCSSLDLPGLVSGIAHAGGAGNVTLPHKSTAAGAVGRITAAVRRTGACNTFWEERGDIWGDNTDVTGVEQAITYLLGEPATGARVLVLGAGGAARAALCALADQRADAVTLLNRTVARAEATAEGFPELEGKIRCIHSAAELQQERFDLVINGTSLGLREDDRLPIELTQIGEARAGLDLVYRPQSTAWVRHLRSHGVPAEDGLRMLVHQGAAAFERWWGIPAPLEAMRNAILRSEADDDAVVASPAR